MVEKQGRNAPCPCGSGRKYKRCCFSGPIPEDEDQAGGRAAYEKAAQYRALGMFEMAESFLRQAVLAAPRDAMAYHELGRVQVVLNRPLDAIQTLRRAIGLQPLLVAAYDDLGAALKVAGEVGEAETLYRKALDLDRRYAPAHQHLGELLRELGSLDQARQSFESALKIDPGLRQARLDLADMLLDRSDFPAAAQHYREAIAAGPVPSAAYVNLGIALKECGDIKGSLDSFEQLVKQNPRSPEAQLSFASALLECGHYAAALVRAHEALRLRSDLAPAHVVLGMIFAAQGDWQEAVASVARSMAPQSTHRQVLSVLSAKLLNIGLHDRVLEGFKLLLEQEPNDVGALHFIASLSGRNPDHPDEAYVRQLFDEYAGTFDQHLQRSLDYTLPRELVENVRAICARPVPWDVLDLGCGTGLVGLEIAPHCRSLIGVDLSPKMIERARCSQVYTELNAANLVSVLEKTPAQSYDVITAADVLLYVGKLDSIVAAISKALRRGGVFGLSAEAAEFSLDTTAHVEACGYWLTTTGRYAHTAAYLKELASLNGFQVKLLRKTRLRTERRRPVVGWLSIWTAAAG